MTLDEWVDLIKHTFGPDDFKEVGVTFLREHYKRDVLLRDGKGDGGVDAWAIPARATRPESRGVSRRQVGAVG